MKKNMAVAMYMMPSFLWSTVNSHAFQPPVVTGRRSVPSDDEGVAGAMTAGVVVTLGRSMMAMLFSGYFSVNR
jgi:hypothetical protein